MKEGRMGSFRPIDLCPDSRRRWRMRRHTGHDSGWIGGWQRRGCYG